MADILTAVLAWPPILVILLVSLFVSVLSVVVYKFTTNQTKLKSIHEEQKNLRAEIKKNQKNPEKAMKLNQRAMELSMEIMPESMKSMIFTFIPIIIIFGWLSANLSFMPLYAGDTFTTSMTFEKLLPGQQATLSASPGLGIVSAATQDVIGDKVVWELKSQAAGTYNLTYVYGSGAYSETYSLPVKISEDGARDYLNPVLARQKKILFLIPSGTGISEKSNIVQIKVDMQPVRPLGQSFNLFGWYPGWLAIYIISSLVFTSVLRKYMKVY